MKIKVFSRAVLMLFVLCAGIQTVFFSETGIRKYRAVTNELYLKRKKIMRIESKIKALQKNIECFLLNDFETQKIARQELQMGFEYEKVYVL